MGINNIGKTTKLVPAVQQLLARRHSKVEVVPDAFRAFPDTSLDANIEVLSTQLVSETAIARGARIAICDRTAVDNYIAMQLRQPTKIGTALEPIVARYAHTYDCLFLLDCEMALTDTARLTSTQRATLRSELEQFCQRHLVSVDHVDVSDPDRAANEIASKVATLV